jgi:hypothetical protein
MRKRQTAAITTKRREAEKQLDIFWEAIDKHYEKNLKKPLHDVLKGIITPRELKRTLEWVEQPSTRPQPQKQDSETSVTEDFSTFHLGHSETGRTQLEERKGKIKTRGQADDRLNVPLPVEHPPEPPLPQIPVSKRAYKVFSTILSTSSSESAPGEIPWTEFLHALASAGLSVQKQYGSAWMFKPLDQTLGGPILIHEPHPGSKIPIQIAWRHGNRLRNAYGWSAESFVAIR